MRSDYCGKLNSSYIDQEVKLYGWVHRRRDHGGVILLIFVIAKALRRSYSIQTVQHRLLLQILFEMNSLFRLLVKSEGGQKAL